jgi:hypothetical protein
MKAKNPIQKEQKSLCIDETKTNKVIIVTEDYIIIKDPHGDSYPVLGHFKGIHSGDYISNAEILPYGEV